MFLKNKMMKTIYKFSFFLILVLIISMGCTDQYEEFKNDNENLTSEDVSAKFFFTNVQTNLWMPRSWNYFFTIRQYSVVYGGYASYGYKNSWEQPDVVFNTTRSWGAAASAWNHWSGYFLKISW